MDNQTYAKDASSCHTRTAHYRELPEPELNMLLRFSRSHADEDVVDGTVQELEPGDAARGDGVPGLPIPSPVIVSN